MLVPIFQNINTYGQYIVDIGKYIKYGLTNIIDIINSAPSVLVQYSQYFPSEFGYILSVLFAVGISSKLCHWNK